jgi:hypothetical protein
MKARGLSQFQSCRYKRVAAKHHSDDESSDVGSDDQSSGQESTDDHSNDSGPVDGQDM